MNIKILENQIGRALKVAPTRKSLSHQTEYVYLEGDKIIQLSIELERTVPFELLNFRHLQTLNLRYTSGLDLSFLKSCENLKELRLYCDVDSIIPEGIFHLKSLQVLYIDHKLIDMDHRILNFENLKELRISIDKNLNKRIEIINQFKLEALSLLDFTSDPKIKLVIQESIRKLSFARSNIDFSDVVFMGTKVSKILIISSIVRNVDFEQLRDLETVKIRLSTLETNFLNNFGTPELILEQVEIVGSFEDIVENNKQINILSISNTKIEDLNIICLLANLEILLITNNSITELPQCLMSLKDLKMLDISFNNISEIDLDLLRSSNLSKINLKHNPINKSSKNDLHLIKDSIDITI